MNFQSSIPLYLKNKLKNSSSFKNSSRLERNFFSNELSEMLDANGEIAAKIKLYFLAYNSSVFNGNTTELY